MNRIYKVIYSKARQCYIVVSELAKSNHKSSQQGADHTNTPALARIIAVALAAGALTWGSVPGVSWAADNTTVTDSNGNEVTNTDLKIKDINANITGKNNKVTDSSNAEIVGDDNTVTNIMEGRGDTVRSNDVRIHGSGNFISGSRNQQVIGDNNKIIARDRGTVTDYQHPEGREENVSDLTIGRGNVIQSNDTYRNEWDSLKVIGNNNRADGEWDGYHAGGPSAGIIIGDNQNLNGIQDTIVIGSLAPSEQQEKKEDNGDLYTAGSNNIIIGYHTTTTQNGGIVIGNRSQGSGVFQTIMGPRSIIGNATGNPDSGAGTMASIYGAFNKVEDAGSSNDSGLDIDGLGNSVNGSLNITSNARGTMIMGVGNTITHAKGPDILGKDEDTPGATGYWVASGLFGADYYAQGADTVAEGNNLNISYDEMRNAWQKYMETSGGAVSVLGNSNNADYVIRSQILGTGNTLQGSETDMSAYNTVSGFANTGTNIKRSAIVGTGNTLRNGEDNVVIGDYHNLENGKHNVILGSMDYTEKQVTKQSKSAWAMTDEHPDGTFEYTVTEQVPVKDHTEDIENAVMVGYNTDAKEDGSVALGSDSIASTKSGLEGYDAQGKKHAKSDKDYAAWVSTDAAVSVGGADREIKYDVLDKDGNPVKDKATGKTKQEPQIVKSTRQITNLAAGTKETDAVNVAQLKASEANINTTINNVDKKVAVIFDDKGSLMSTDAIIDHEHENGYRITNVSKGIALGHNAYVYNQGGRKADAMLFGSPTYTSGIAIGENSYVLEDSIDLGNKIYKGAMGDVSDLSKYDAKTSSGTGRLLIGNNSYSSGTLSTLIGNHSIMTTNYLNGNSSNAMQNAGAVSIGALNSIESYRANSNMSGVANSIVGLANKTNNANGALIYGAGNTITNSFADVATPGYVNSAAEAAQSFRKSVQNNPGGAALAIGGGNEIDRAVRSQVIGVDNKLTGNLYHKDAEYFWIFVKNPEINEYSAQYNMVDGYNNQIANVNHAYVIGANNIIQGKQFSDATKDGVLSEKDRDKAKKDDNLIVIGDNHTLANDVSNNIILGTADADKKLTTSASNVVMIGYNADAKKEGGVALGAGSVASVDKASTDANAIGYDPATKKASTDASSTWKSTAAAVSIGDASQNITRQITNLAAGAQDTDAVNVAQLKAAQTHFYSVNSTDETADNYNNDGAKGKNSLAAGVGALANGSNSVAIGTKAKAQNDALAVGESANAGNNGIAIGMHANAGYGQNMALGYYASVANGVSNSTALGYGSQVTKRDILQSDGSDGVVSVGKSVGQSGEKGMTRRIINVKDGVKATDAANVSQLTELKEGDHISIVDSATPNEKGQTVKTISVKVDGQIKEGDTGILSGDTVYNEVHVKENGNYIRSNQTVAENLKALDSHVKTNADNIEKNGQAIEKNSARIDTNSQNI
ncbi:ESPR-type extended signal peptide-containing protein, partial [Mitsuokella multacida]|uniref:ESPR-type extended signal peptide-containing protein n=1 Tax=Mitsuokella multacida TaxID=52226 RepID=UPI00248F8173